MAVHHDQDVTLFLDWIGRARAFADGLGVSVALTLFAIVYVANPGLIAVSSVHRLLDGAAWFYVAFLLVGGPLTVWGILGGAPRVEAAGRCLLASAFGVQAVASFYVNVGRAIPLSAAYIALSLTFAMRVYLLVRQVPVRAYPVTPPLFTEPTDDGR